MSSKVSAYLVLVIVFCLGLTAQQVAPPKTEPPTPAPQIEQEKDPAQKLADYSREGYVVEQITTKARFEKDGTGTQVKTARIRLQSDSAVQQLGQLVFGFSAATERLKIDYVRVRKSDGSVVTAPTSSFQEMTAPVAREAPVYTDFKQMHVTVPALRPGEVLEYQTTTDDFAPLAPNQFWMEYEFAKQGVVLDERLEINVPRESKIKLKTQTGFDPKVVEEDGRTIYRWQYSKLKPDVDDDDNDTTKRAELRKQYRAKRKDAETADVQMTTFASWDQVGSWYSKLEGDRREVTPELKAKALELTKDKKTELEKIEALYDFVAVNYRYVSLSFGVGRYQPHSANEIYANLYGDCKDKHTLLATMLKAVGIQANTILINSQRKMDPEVPSPSQFNHVITAIPLGSEPVWVDTTTEVAPFQLLASTLRDKQALMVTNSGEGKVVTTPAQPSVVNEQRISVEGKLTEFGKLESSGKITARGDWELMLRSTFRRVPPANWKQMVKAMLAYDGQQAEVLDVKVSDPAKTKEPFVLEYKITQPNYLDWTSKTSRLRLPMPPVRLNEPDVDDPDPEELKIGPMMIEARVKLEVPERFKLRMPAPISVARPYGEYRSSYGMANGVVTAERMIKTTVVDLDPARVRDFIAFRRTVNADGDQMVAVQQDQVAEAPVMADAKVDDLYEAAVGAHRAENCLLAVDLYKQVVAKDPKHASAWLYLGRCYMNLNRYEDAISAYNHQLEINAYDENANRDIGLAYFAQQKYDEAIAALRKQLEVNPMDGASHANIGRIFVQQKKYKEAVEELERAASMLPDDPGTLMTLGDAALKLGEVDKAKPAFNRALELAPTPLVWNNVAYSYAESKVNLDDAQRYAESAVQTTAAILRNLTPGQAGMKEVGLSGSLGAYWDTLGWVHFHKGNLDLAEKYMLAAWKERQNGEVGDHLGQLYERKKNRKMAIQMYARSLASEAPPKDTRGRLANLIGDDRAVDARVKQERDALAKERTTKMGSLLKENASAYFLLIFGQNAASGSGRPEQVQFMTGNEKLKVFGDKLMTGTYSYTFPDNTPTKLVRRGKMSCSGTTGECAFTIVTSDSDPILLEQAAAVDPKEGGK
jgi:tetratricopeptide (TPR) repeat protein